MIISKSTFAFCECFTGKRIISKARWLKKLEYELNFFKVDEIISFERFIDSINFLLSEEAVEWVEISPNAVRLLGEEEFTAETMFSFRSLFQERFLAKSVESSTTSFYIELEEFHQKQDEIINSYYKPLLVLMACDEARDRSAVGSLFLLESSTLRVIMKPFAFDLYDDEVRRKAIRDLIVPNRSLRDLCSLAENAYRFKKELEKLMKKKNRTIELQFYRDMTARAMSRDRIDFMLASYRAGPTSADWISINNLFDQLAKKLQSNRLQFVFFKSFSLGNIIENLTMPSKFNR